jgi:hypothetical protein
VSFLERDSIGRRLFDVVGRLQHTVDNLSTPYSDLEEPIKNGVPTESAAALAQDIARLDVLLLVEVNTARPSAMLRWRVARGHAAQPNDESSYCSAVEALRSSISPRDMVEVVNRHLPNLGLPYHPEWLGA